MTAAQRRAFDEMVEFGALFVVKMDGEEHARVRRIVQRAFTPQRIAQLQQATMAYVDESVDTLLDNEVTDLMHLAYTIPLMVIGDMLGTPVEDRDLIKQWSTTWFEYRQVADDRILKAAEAGRNYHDYVLGIVDDHRRSDREGSLVSDLIGAERDERLSPDELAAMFFVLLFAGHETTTNLIGTGTLELLRHRDQWTVLRDDPSLVPQATEELVRYVTPVQFSERFAEEDVDFAGMTIPVGTSVFGSFASANRDPYVFDAPDVLDVRRADASKHLAFGFGPHFCLGAHLARLEATIVFAVLTSRFPEMELASSDFHWRGAPLLRGLEELPVLPGPCHPAI